MNNDSKTPEVEIKESLNGVYLPPSVDHAAVLSGQSYAYYSPIPKAIAENGIEECTLGIDEAGRGPVLGPMVYSAFYLPSQLHKSLLADTHSFDDSKILTPEVRSSLMEKLCTKQTDLFQNCGWSVKLLSAQDISSGMLRSGMTYNLNAQAIDATVELLQHILDIGVNVRNVYVDTLGKPEVHQKRLERLFPTLNIKVEKKADSLYPAVSAASVCAKVTRDAALEVCQQAYSEPLEARHDDNNMEPSWGSGYPSDARCVTWLKNNMHPVFGWGNECRYSWGTTKDLLDEGPRTQLRVDWPDAEEMDSHFMSSWMGNGEGAKVIDGTTQWYGHHVTTEII